MLEKVSSKIIWNPNLKSFLMIFDLIWNHQCCHDFHFELKSVCCWFSNKQSQKKHFCQTLCYIVHSFRCSVFSFLWEAVLGIRTCELCSLHRQYLSLKLYSILQWRKCSYTVTHQFLHQRQLNASSALQDLWKCKETELTFWP